jgi:hypothetical protein
MAFLHQRGSANRSLMLPRCLLRFSALALRQDSGSFNFRKMGMQRSAGKEFATYLEGQPGVEAVAAVNTLPTQITPTMPFNIYGRPAGTPNAGGSEDYMPITADYFKALQIPVMAGRLFRTLDSPGAQPVIVINEQFARTYFKGQSPLGQHIRIGAGMGPGFEDKVREIVGIVGDTKE